MALNDLTDQNIQDTYQKVVQTDGTNLADGTGSLLPISFDGNNVTISGSITANEYIVSSSVTNITVATLSGSTTFGDSADDTHTFTGAITASTDISASGDIYGTKFQAYNSGLSGSYLNSNELVIHESDSNTEAISLIGSAAKGTLLMKYNNAARVYLDPVNDSYIWTNGDLGIGHNSPSYKLDVNGTGRFSTTLLVGSTLTVQGSSIFGTTHPSYGNTNTHTFIGHITASDNISASAAGTVSAGSGSFHVLKGDTTAATGLSVAGYIEATHITASGNISSSGNLYGTKVHIPTNGHLYLETGNDTSQYITCDGTTLQIKSNDLYHNGNSFRTGGHITASGNISSSGTITANAYVGLPTGILSSSNQIATSISGAFTAASASFSTRVTLNDAKVGYTDAAVKTKLNTEGVLSSSAQLPTGIISSSLQDLGNITGSNISSSGNIQANYIIAKIPMIQCQTTDDTSDIYTSTAFHIGWDVQEIIDSDYFTHAHTDAAEDHKIFVDTAGRYEVTFTVVYNNPSASPVRATPQVRINKNGTATGYATNFGYLRRVSGTNVSSTMGTYVVECAADDYITISSMWKASWGADSASPVESLFMAGDSTTVTIKKIG